MQRSRGEQPQAERGWGTHSRPLSVPEDTGHRVGIPSGGTAAGSGSIGMSQAQVVWDSVAKGQQGKREDGPGEKLE